MSINFKTNLKKIDLKIKIEKELNLQGKGVEIGFFESAKYNTGASVASVAFWNEYGTCRIPPRPFFRVAIEKNQKKWREVLANSIKQSGNAEDALGAMGAIAKGDIQQSITSLRTPPNAISTILKKESSNPLIDTGMMRRSVAYRIIK